MAGLEQQIAVAEYRIGLSRMGFGSFFEPGFTGWCAFSARKKAGPEVLRWAGALARFAYFSGVGAKTTMGMGQARLAPPEGAK
jgi:CRISPR-associated endoribonuclease Cas6